MNLNPLNRKIHYWISFVVALPLLVIIVTGLTLQMKKHWTWVQPPEQRGGSSVPQVDLEQMLATVMALPELGVSGWDDVHRLDIRPSRGIAKFSLHSAWEVQVDLASGDVLHSASRRSDWIESLHDGSYFAGDLTRLGLFLPSGIALLWLLLSGLWMWWVPFGALRRREARKRAAGRDVGV